MIEENLFILSRTEKIFEIISNILTNAIKYNKINGEIEIHLKKDDDKNYFKKLKIQVMALNKVI